MGGLGVRLTETQRFQEALEVDQEALGLLASLRSDDLDRHAELSQRAVTNLVIDLRDLGRSESQIKDELAALGFELP